MSNAPIGLLRSNHSCPLAKMKEGQGAGNRTSGPDRHLAVANGHRGVRLARRVNTLSVWGGSDVRGWDACASRHLGLLLRRESTTSCPTAGGPGADTMRCATLATMGTSLLLAGCANGWFPSPIPLLPSPSPPAVALAGSRASPGADCAAKASTPFGSGVDTTSLSQLIDDPARNNPAAQSCAWEKGTRVSYGSPSLTTGALAERK